MDIKPFVDAIESKRIDLIGVNVRQHDHEIADHCWRTNDRLDLRSCSKGVTCLAVGMAVDEGLFSLEDKVTDHFLMTAEKKAAWENVTLRDLPVTTGLIISFQICRFFSPGPVLFIIMLLHIYLGALSKKRAEFVCVIG